MDEIADRLLRVLSKHQTMLNTKWNYPHIEPFDEAEVKAFLEGKRGADTRSYQIIQALSCIGARLVDADEADAETEYVYHACWKIEISTDCPYCKRRFRSKLMMRNATCLKPRCMLIDMRESV